MLMKCFVISLFLVTGVIFAEEKSDYPELQVSPRASERLALESEYEHDRPYKFQMPITYASAATLFTALTLDTDTGRDPDRHARMTGTIVGAGWLALNMYMAYSYRAYSSANQKISILPSKTAREQLVKERMAEEELNHLGRIGRTMKWGSFATNLLSSAYMASNAKRNSNSKVYSGLAVVTSFLPLIFSNHFETVAAEQQQYKKKIFGTISSNFLFLDPVTNKLKAGVGFTATF